MTGRAALAFLAVSLIWGTSFMFIRIALDEVTPLQVVFCRCAGGAAALLLLVGLQRRSLGLSRRNLGFALVLSLVGTLAPFFLIAWAEQELESGPASVLNGTMPLFVLVFATALLPDERLTAERAVGVAVGLAGVIILVGRDVVDLASSSLTAQVAMLASSACYAIAAIITRVALRGWDAASLSTVQITAVTIMAAPLLVAFETPKADLAWDTWLSLLWLGVLGTGVAYIAYYRLIENVGSVRASLVIYMLPVVGVTAGAIVLDERIAWNMLAGGVVVLAGIAIGNGLVRPPQRRQAIAGAPGQSG